MSLQKQTVLHLKSPRKILISDQQNRRLRRNIKVMFTIGPVLATPPSTYNKVTESINFISKIKFSDQYGKQGHALSQEALTMRLTLEREAEKSFC